MINLIKVEENPLEIPLLNETKVPIRKKTLISARLSFVITTGIATKELNIITPELNQELTIADLNKLLNICAYSFR